MTIIERLHSFEAAHKLNIIAKISRGFSAEIHLVTNQRGKKFALKIERDDSGRRDFVYKESEHLRLANTVNVGPRLIETDYENKCILMEFIDGEPFYKWVMNENPSNARLKKCIADLLKQARRLDDVGLDHGQLAGRGKNILVKKNGLPVIIDFEKGSQARKPHNTGQLESFLFKNPHSQLTKTINEKLKIQHRTS